MKNIIVALCVLAVFAFSNSAVAEEKERVFGNVSLVYVVDDFSDEESEGLFVMESGFMPKNAFFVWSASTGLTFGYKHQSFILEDKGRIKYRINKDTPVSLQCVNNSGNRAAYVFDQAVARSFLSALVAADTTTTLNLVLMVEGESDSKVQFDFAGVSRAVEAAKLVKLK
jgi:hypothetical protein